MLSHKFEGHLLCILPFPEPKAVLAKLTHRFPGVRISYYSTRSSTDRKEGPGYQDNIWRDVNYLCTLSDFPSNTQLAPQLEFIHVVNAGTNHLWQQPIWTDTEIPITTSSGIHGPTIAEWVVMTCLVASRRYLDLYRSQTKEYWPHKPGSKDAFYEVSDNVGKKFGILGYGSIGRQVARSVHAMGMEVIAYTASMRDSPESRKDHGYIIPGTGDPEGSIPTEWHHGTEMQSLHSFLARDLDYLLICVPLTHATRGLIGKTELDILSKRNAFIINVARGEIIVQDELIRALWTYEKKVTVDGQARTGIRGAALDVTDPEPLPPGHALWKAPNCIITPHMSAIHENYAERAFDVLCVNLERHAAGQRLINLVDRKLGYSSRQA